MIFDVYWIGDGKSRTRGPALDRDRLRMRWNAVPAAPLIDDIQVKDAVLPPARSFPRVRATADCRRLSGRCLMTAR